MGGEGWRLLFAEILPIIPKITFDNTKKLGKIKNNKKKYFFPLKTTLSRQKIIANLVFSQFFTVFYTFTFFLILFLAFHDFQMFSTYIPLFQPFSIFLTVLNFWHHPKTLRDSVSSVCGTFCNGLFPKICFFTTTRVL